MHERREGNCAFPLFRLASLAVKKAIVLSLAAFVLLSSCSSPEADSAVLQVAVSQEPPTLDVHVNSSQVARYIMAGNVFERLVTLDGEGRAVPELCSSFEAGEGNRSWTFHLREGVLLHNGREMDSTDVTLSLNRWIGFNSSVQQMLSGARFEAVDRYTVRIESDESMLFLPEMMASSPQSAVIYAREMLESLDGEGLVTEYIGTGPYCFTEWIPGQHVRLTRFEEYCPYGGEMDGLAGYKHAYIPVLVYNFVPDAFARTAGCESGQYLFINDMMSDDEERLRKNDGLVVSRGEEAGSFVLLFNKRSPLTGQQWVRTAINTAIDADVIMAACYGSGGYNMHGDYMEAGQELWLPPFDESRYDIGDKASARAMLQEHAYDGTPVRILSSNLSNMDRSAIALASELEKAGFAAEVEIVDWATMMAWRSDETRWDICITAMTQVPLPSLKLFLSPDYAGWSDDALLQELMAAFNAATSIEEAQAIWAEIQDYCLDYLPAIVCGHYTSGNLYRKELAGVEERYGFYFYNAVIRN